MNIEDFNPVITKADRVALERGYVFDPAKADWPVKFIEKVCKQSIGPFKGMPLKLIDWQKEAIWRTYGWINSETGYRRHRELFVQVPKKQGKGELASALGLYHLTADGEAVPKIALAACDKKQAGETYLEARRMVGKSKWLAKRLHCSDYHKTITYRDVDGVIQTNSSDADGADGGNFSAVVIDELHRWTKSMRNAWNVYCGSGAARAQPLKIVISTAGEERHSVMFEQYQRACAIADGTNDFDLGFCGVVYGPRPGEAIDVHSEDTWRRFNPSLGVTMTLEGFRADYQAAKSSPEQFAYWKRTRLNVWGEGENKFIHPDAWVACGEVPRRTEAEIAAAGDSWFDGYDLASTSDMTAWVAVAGDLENGIDVWCKVWLPEAAIEGRKAALGDTYANWVREGWIEVIPGPRIDESVILEYAKAEHARRHYVRAYGDWYHATTFGAGLQANGIPFKVIRQGALSLNAPTRELERLVATGKVRHGNNPVLTWALSNAVVVRESNDLRRISRDRSSEKIDPAAALVNAIAGLIDQQVERAKERKPFKNLDMVWA